MSLDDEKCLLRGVFKYEADGAARYGDPTTILRAMYLAVDDLDGLSARAFAAPPEGEDAAAAERRGIDAMGAAEAGRARVAAEAEERDRATRPGAFDFVP